MGGSPDAPFGACPSRYGKRRQEGVAGVGRQGERVVVEPVLLFVRIGLSLVFVLAAAGKLASGSGPADLLETFELGRWARPAVRTLPFAELVVALGLLFQGTARLSAVAAAGMLGVFSVLLVRQVARGRETTCNCFGSMGASMTGPRALGRNIFLLVASLVVAGVRTGPGMRVLSVGPVGAAAFGVAVDCGAVAAVFAWSRWRAPNRAGRGGRRSVPELVAGGRRTLVLFLEPHCAPCRSLLPALARFGTGTAPGAPLVVVTKEGSEIDAEFAAATAGAWHHVRDEGRIAGRLGVPAMPTAALVRADGSLEELVVGAPGVARLLIDDAPGSSTAAPELQPPAMLSRRRFLSLAGLAGFAGAMVLPGVGGGLSLRNLRRVLSASSGVTCPSCGSCVICSASSSSPKKLSCGGCSQRCSGHKLCASYANEFAPFTDLAGYLRNKSFVQDGDVLTYGLEKDGKLTVLSGVTTFKGGPDATPTAVLIYELTDGGQKAWAALKDRKGVVSSVATVVDTQVVSAAVSPPPPTATVASPPPAGDSRALPEAAATSPYSCSDVCAFALGVAIAIATLPATIMASPEIAGGAALAFAGSLFAGGVGLASGPTGDALATLLPLVQAASMVDGVLGGLAGLGDAKGAEYFCENFACKLLKFCCTSNGACYDSDSVCEHDCPAGLAHPLSHCNAYLDGKIISTLVAP